MMAVEGPYLAAVVARLPDPTLGLAAYGVAIAMAVLIEAPVIMLLSASTALVEDAVSYRRLRAFAHGLNVFSTLLLLLVLVPPVHHGLMIGVLGLPEDLAHLTYGALWCFLPWPAAIGYRRFWQGVLIRLGAHAPRGGRDGAAPDRDVDGRDRARRLHRPARRLGRRLRALVRCGRGGGRGPLDGPGRDRCPARPGRPGGERGRRAARSRPTRTTSRRSAARASPPRTRPPTRPRAVSCASRTSGASTCLWRSLRSSGSPSSPC